MAIQSKSSRRFLAGFVLVLVATAMNFGLRGMSPAYEPDAPDYRQKGPRDAPIVIAEFSDFQCPGCRAAVEPLGRIRTMFPGKVRIIFKHYPWPFHRWARQAAIASECAGRQGLFWKYHDLLFTHQASWAAIKDARKFRRTLYAYAKKVGVRREGFSRCIQDPTVERSVVSDLEEAKRHWVNSTPTFFINGRRFVGALQLRTHGLNHIENLLKP